MKKFAKSLISGLMLVGLTTISAVALDNTIISPQTNVASAKVKKIVWTHNLKHTRYLISKGNFYNRTLSKGVWKAQNHATKDWTAMRSEKVKKSNGKYAIYYEMKSGNKTGWIWRGYVQKSKKFVYNSKTMIKRSTFNKDFDMITAARNNSNSVKGYLPISRIISTKATGIKAYQNLSDFDDSISKMIGIYDTSSSSENEDPRNSDALWSIYQQFRSRLRPAYRTSLDSQKEDIYDFPSNSDYEGPRMAINNFSNELGEAINDYGHNLRYIY